MSNDAVTTNSFCVCERERGHLRTTAAPAAGTDVQRTACTRLQLACLAFLRACHIIFFFFLRGKSLLAGNSYVEAGPLRLCPCAATPHTHTHKYTQIHAQRDPSRVKTNPLYAAHLPIRLAFLFFFQGFGTGELDGVLADYVGPNIVLNSMYL